MIAVSVAASRGALGQPPAEPHPEWQLGAALEGRKYFLDYSSSPSTDGTQEDGLIEVTKFYQPLLDDGAPYSLAPYLQRASLWFVRLQGGHFATRNPFGGPSRTDWNSGLDLGIDDYLKRWLALTGAAAVGYSALADAGVNQATRTFSGALGVGLRTGDIRFDGRYQVTTQESDVGPTVVRQSVDVSMLAAIRRRFTVEPSGALIAGGAQAALTLEGFPARSLGIFASGFLGSGKFYTSDQTYRRYTTSAGVLGWIDPRLGVGGSYQFLYERPSDQLLAPTLVGYHQSAHTITLDLRVRM